MRWLSKLLLVTMFLMELSIANAANANGILQKAQIVLTTGSTKAKSNLDQWLGVCEAFGRQLSQRAGVYGHGIFTEVSCEKVVDALDNFQSSPDFGWLIQVDERRQQTTITAYLNLYHDGEHELRKEGQVDFSHESNFLKLSSDTQFLQTISLALLDHLPFARAFDVRKDGRGFEVTRPGEFPLPPVEYALYSTSYSKELEMWFPTVIGYARRALTPAERLEAAGEAVPANVAEPRTFRYRTFFYTNMAVPGQQYWAHSSEGRNQSGARLVESLSLSRPDMGIISFFDELFFDSLSSSYFGIRYGHPLVSGEDLITKSSMIGILAEFRAGPFDGLRLYWDFAPEIKEMIDSQEHSLSWSRASLGWSFSLGLPDFLSSIVSRIDIHPKIGMMNFESRVPVGDAVNDDVSFSSFTANGSLDLGIELGIEKSTRWLLFRLWVASNFSGLIPQAGSDVRISSQRAGVDAYYDLFQMWGGTHFGLTFFSFSEMLSLTKTDVPLELPDQFADDFFIESVSFNLFFAGIGLTVSW